MLPDTTFLGGAQQSRRDLLRWAALAAGALGASELLTACGGGGGASSGGQQQAAAGSLRILVADVPQLSILGAQSLLPAGRSRFAFGLAGVTNALVEGASPQVWLARDQTSRALGPFPARWLKLTAYQQTHDRSPRSQLNGFYLAEVDLPQPGTWQAGAIVEVASQRAAGQGAIKISQQVPAPVGSKARSGPTPVATSPEGIAGQNEPPAQRPRRRSSWRPAAISTVVGFPQDRVKNSTRGSPGLTAGPGLTTGDGLVAAGAQAECWDSAKPQVQQYLVPLGLVWHDLAR